MKKCFSIKALALVLVLATAFGVSASAIEGEPVAQAAIDICVGQIVSVRQLAQDAGYAWPSIPYTGVHVSCDGAVTDEKHGNDWHVIYGARAGQGSASVYVSGAEFVVDFNVTAAVNPLVYELRVSNEERFTLDALLAGAGYTADDVARYAYWDNKTSGTAGILFSSSPRSFSTNNNGTGASQILLNMNDGRVILINVSVEYNNSFGRKLLGFFELLFYPVLALLTPIYNLLVLAQPLQFLSSWFHGFSEFFRPTFYDITPVFSF